MRRKHHAVYVSAAMIGLLVIVLSSFGSALWTTAENPKSSADFADSADSAGSSDFADSANSFADSAGSAGNPADSWIAVWKGDPPQAFLRDSEVLREHAGSHVTVARPGSGEDPALWAEGWAGSKEALSFERNQSYRVAAVAPNDPMLSHQAYLQQIHVPETWGTTVGGKKVVIAVVDTGVELDHPDLAPALVKGVNLVHPGTPPEDDNGHGTNVAGVIAAAAGNEKGIAGIMPSARIMPVKALEADGTGDEDLLGEGVRYAVDHGADIVVLSLGLNKPSTYMESVVRYAESKGVLLVAAAGNEGKDVKYPAAYSTVLAVGGAMEDNTRAVMSNYGPELDVIAPWNVFTTSLKGTYSFSGGTSLAAPQAAAVCGLVLAHHPELAPYEVRTLIRETAEDLGAAGWDKETGYGLLRADRALAAADAAKVYSYAGTARETARKLPMNKQTDLRVPEDGNGLDGWLSLAAPYDGDVDLSITPGKLLKGADLEAYYEGEQKSVSPAQNPNGTYTLPVKTGNLFIRLRLPAAEGGAGVHLTPVFRMAKDRFESNDRAYMAYSLAPRNHVLTGTFDHSGDEDWFTLKVDRPGKLSLKAATVSQRIDLTLLLRRADEPEQAVTVDQTDEGMAERIDRAEVRPGVYCIRVGSVERSDSPPTGEYTLRVDYDSETLDPREPDDKLYEASELRPDSAYSGVIRTEDDQDWYRFKISQEKSVKLALTSEWTAGVLDLAILDSAAKPIAVGRAQPVQGDLQLREVVCSLRLKPGVYYVKVSAAKEGKVEEQPYSLKLAQTD